MFLEIGHGADVISVDRVGECGTEASRPGDCVRSTVQCRNITRRYPAVSGNCLRSSDSVPGPAGRLPWPSRAVPRPAGRRRGGPVPAGRRAGALSGDQRALAQQSADNLTPLTDGN